MEKCTGIDVSARVIKNYLYHWHDDMTIVMVASGQVKLRVWAKDNMMEEGDIIVVNRGEVHKLTAITEDNLVIVISFDKKVCIEASFDFEESIIFCNSVQCKNDNKEMYQELKKQLIKFMYVYQKEGDCNCRERAKEIIRLLCHDFDFISSGIRHQRFSDYIIKRNRWVFRKVFAENGEMSEMNLKEIADYLGVNYAYLRGDIIERFGYGFTWLKYKMMTENAAKMILTTDKRLIDISNQCGFSDQKYLRKYINIFFECNPSEFRKQYKNQKHDNSYMETSYSVLME